jgi:hypothetical protein
MSREKGSEGEWATFGIGKGGEEKKEKKEKIERKKQEGVHC